MFKLKLINKPKMIKLKCGFSFPNIVLANLQEKEVIPTKEVQEIVADKTYDGLSKVTVQSIPNEYIVPSGEIEFTQNGTYDVTDKASAKVNIKEKVLGTKTITSNGTYKAIDDSLDGYSEVEVATSGVDINEYLSDTITKGTSSLGGWANTILKLRSPLTIEGTDASNMFNGYPLNEIPEIDTSNVINMSYMFAYAKKITTIPLLNTSNVTNMTKMFFQCVLLKEIPPINTQNVKIIENMFAYCQNLITIPRINTSKVNSFNSLFTNCNKIQTIPLLNAENVRNLYHMFQGCIELTTLGGFQNLGQGYLTTVSANYQYYSLNLSVCSKLSHDSLMSVINNLYDIKTKGVKPQQLILGTTNLEKLSEEERNIAVSKGWSIS